MLVALLVVAALQDATPPVDARTLERLDEACTSRISLREVTLFANGTVRLRESAGGGITTTLGELGRAEVEAFERRLADVEFSDVEVQSSGPEGDWVERCRLRVALAEEPVRTLVYSRLDSGSLELDELRRIVDDLVEVARRGGGSAEIPAAYQPRLGDRLERADGAVFEVVGFTSDGRAVELVSDAPPLTLYVEAAQLRTEFRRVVSRRPAR